MRARIEVEQKEPSYRKFDIRYDLYGQGEPQVVPFRPGTMTEAEKIPLPEAERRGIVSKEEAEHARSLNQRIREVTTKVLRDS